MKKVCTICKKKKSIENFYNKKSSKDNKQPACKECSKKQSKIYYNNNKKLHNNNVYERNKLFKQELRNQINEYKSSQGCFICNEKEPICLDFHHLENKEYLLSRLLSSRSIRKFEQEIKKCTLLCSNCHRKLHSGIIIDKNLRKCNFQFKKITIKKINGNYQLINH